VVSLLGIEQAKFIDTLVRSRCSALDLQQRAFACGDARTFQGSERDILFLSLVVDPSSARAVSGAMFEQRFNVAASRARDRMVLVRSVKSTDLSTKDLRLGLLQHFEKPEGEAGPAEGEDPNLIDRCTSAFERELYTALRDGGYRVLPQVPAGTHRIDLVVEGDNDLRLAIECDGDEYHGPERWATDMARQRVLERAGWTFWRCFAADWITARAAVLQELATRLDTLGIVPLGAPTGLPGSVDVRHTHST
jgi:very-short-patch-repair endonuclease